MGARVRASLVIAALVVSVLAVAAPLLLRVCAPQAAVNGRFNRNFDRLAPIVQGGHGDDGDASEFKDPWGRPWRVEKNTVSALGVHLKAMRPCFGLEDGSVGIIYSMGPDGEDDLGLDDDVYPTTSNSLRWVSAAYAAEGLGAIGLVLLWWRAWVGLARRGRRGEALVVLAMVTPPIALGAFVVHQLGATPGTRDLIRWSPFSQLPAAVVAVGSLALVTLVLALAVRLVGAPRSEPEETAPPSEGAPAP